MAQKNSGAKNIRLAFWGALILFHDPKSLSSAAKRGVEGGKLVMCEIQLATFLVYFIDSVFNQRECLI